jgi:hypothetical protein
LENLWVLLRITSFEKYCLSVHFDCGDVLMWMWKEVIWFLKISVITVKVILFVTLLSESHHQYASTIVLELPL